jgi:uncharacterized protein DUF4340
MALRSIGPHLALFTGALVLALRAWTAEEEPAKKHVEAELWGGPVQSVERVEFDSGKQRVLVEPKSDPAGRYYIGTVEDVPQPKPPAKASAPGADAGAESKPADPHDPHDPHDGHGHEAAPSKPEDSTPKPPRRFISLEKGEELVKSVSTMKVSRVIGKVPEDRLAQFGLDKDDKGSLKVVMGGKEHRLLLGDKTPGGNDRYVKSPDSGEAYVIAGSIVDDLTSAESRLVEREFHGWEDSDVTKVTIRTADGSRDVVRVPDEKDFWASPDSPQTKDETVSNWMTKVNRLRVTTYLEDTAPQPKPEQQVAVVEYYNARGTKLGYLELYRQTSEKEKDRNEYLAKSEQSRWFATVLRSSAEQIDQDLKSIVTK